MITDRARTMNGRVNQSIDQQIIHQRYGAGVLERPKRAKRPPRRDVDDDDDVDGRR